MVIWCYKSYLTIRSDKEPNTDVLKPLPSDTIQEREQKLNKPYVNKTKVLFEIDYLGTVYIIDIPKNYRWDGASIPRIFWRIIGPKGDTTFLNASMVHDIICENKYLVAYDRQLSSIILREMLLASGVAKWRAIIMYNIVDFVQKYFCDWRNQ